MKYLHTFLMIYSLILLMTACGGTVKNMPLENTPESVAVNYTEAVFRHDVALLDSLRSQLGDHPSKYYKNTDDAHIQRLEKENAGMKIKIEGQESNGYTIIIQLSITNFIDFAKGTPIEEPASVYVKVMKEKEQWKVVDFYDSYNW